MTPENDPQKNGTIEAGRGNQDGVDPCSPDGKRPIMCRIPSYSRKYSAVPEVSRTEGQITPVSFAKLERQEAKRTKVEREANV